MCRYCDYYDELCCRENFEELEEAMRNHDPWRKAYCIFYYYILRKYDLKGLKAAILHVILNLFKMNMSSKGIADLTTFSRILDAWFESFNEPFETIAELKKVKEEIWQLRDKILDNLINILKSIIEDDKTLR